MAKQFYIYGLYLLFFLFSMIILGDYPIIGGILASYSVIQALSVWEEGRELKKNFKRYLEKL